VVAIALQTQPDIELRRELFRIAGVAVLFAGFSAIGGYVNSLRKDLEVVNARLLASLNQAQALARIDGLTGCYNRRYGLELLEMECARAARGSALSIALADLDHFKAVNDSGGHAAGDAVLVRFAQIVQANLRSTDFLVRYGGEEFLIVFSQTPLEGAQLVAERLRQASGTIAVAGLPSRRLSVSIGLAQHRSGDSAEATMARADAALYRAKREGRDRVVCAEGAELVAQEA
jgi:diguanylate cyclase (GGDEF)-like protein